MSRLRAGRYRLSFLEEFQGATDISVAPFYAQLDRAFPASRFVLTVRELERMRRECGAGFIAFGWPSFWWLEHYAALDAHLRTRYECVLENRRLVVFDLRRS